MEKLATFVTPKGTSIELRSASAGRVQVVIAAGKFVGMLDALVDTAEHGKVIKLKGSAPIVPVGSNADIVLAAIAESKALADAAAAKADAAIAAHAATPEGRVEALMARFDREDREV